MNNQPTRSTKPIKEYAVGDIVLGTVRGFPPWPGMVEDLNDVPDVVLHERPPGWKSSFRCVMFFPKADYAWLSAQDLSPLLPNEIEAFLSNDFNHKRKIELTRAHKVARDPSGWVKEVRSAHIQLLRKLSELERYAKIDDSESESDGGDEEDVEVDQLEFESDVEEEAEVEVEDLVAGKEAELAASKKRKLVSDVEAPTKNKRAKTVDELQTRVEAMKSGPKSYWAMIQSENEGEEEEEEEEDEEEEDEEEEGVAGPSMTETPPPAKRARRDEDHDRDVDDSQTPAYPQSVNVCHWGHELRQTSPSNKSAPAANARATSSLISSRSPEYPVAYGRNGSTINILNDDEGDEG
ncbi:unnamed protein product [Cyclocybe aegerita]|uniref:PWWP domain-containing protein n=1 Tax=Cyclocybe aegerita TaxID=1973307 RepID=A0A8S0VUI2_CYCAE|nr:unnamed protein product [Cyclocybe aegerita]